MSTIDSLVAGVNALGVAARALVARQDSREERLAKNEEIRKANKERLAKIESGEIKKPAPITTQVMRGKQDSSIDDGAKAIATRMENAHRETVNTIMSLGRVSQSEAEAVFQKYLKANLLKLDIANSRYTVKHGALLDTDVIRKNAERNDAAELPPEGKALVALIESVREDADRPSDRVRKENAQLEHAYGDPNKSADQKAKIMQNIRDLQDRLRDLNRAERM